MLAAFLHGELPFPDPFPVRFCLSTQRNENTRRTAGCFRFLLPVSVLYPYP
jgi:hypothetical protein